MEKHLHSDIVRCKIIELVPSVWLYSWHLANLLLFCQLRLGLMQGFWTMMLVSQIIWSSLAKEEVQRHPPVPFQCPNTLLYHSTDAFQYHTSQMKERTHQLGRGNGLWNASVRDYIRAGTWEISKKKIAEKVRGK